MSKDFGVGLRTGAGLGAAAGLGLVAAGAILIGDPGTAFGLPTGIARIVRVLAFLLVILGTGRSMASDTTRQRSTVLGAGIGAGLVFAVLLGSTVVWAQGQIEGISDWLLAFVGPVALALGGLLGLGLLLTGRAPLTARSVPRVAAAIGGLSLVAAWLFYLGAKFTDAAPRARVIVPLMLASLAAGFFAAAAAPSLERSPVVSTMWRSTFGLIALVLVVFLGTT